MIQLILLIVSLNPVRNQISLQHTNDGIDIQFYDCVHLQSLDYCRRPREPANLTRQSESKECERNDGHLHRFSELRASNITVNTLLHQWRSTLEELEEYSLFLRDPSKQDGSICQCRQQASFGKKCEYQLPVGRTIEETLQWQLTMRTNHSDKVQIYGDVVCYETLECNSGVLCLDWREVCDGIQHCLEGRDEENCDLLEMNQCDPEEEYRCENGMCIPKEFFLDGDLDCLDWSDEMQFKDSSVCFSQSVNTECDDRLCRAFLWSCGDGQCIEHRLWFQRMSLSITCHSGRDQYFMCETRLWDPRWTLRNGRCVRGDVYQSLSVAHRNDDEPCEYLLKCLLLNDVERSSLCSEELNHACPLSLIQYPRRAVVTPFTYFLFNLSRDRRNNRPDFLLINGTARCRDALITVTNKKIRFDNRWSDREIVDEHFCEPFMSNLSSAALLSTRQRCHRWNESSDVCNEWNPCLSNTRINDGWWNCLNDRDEDERSEMEVEKNCARVRRDRFRCSDDEPVCLTVFALGDRYAHCRSRFDELWFGGGRTISYIGCNDQRQDGCSFVREYIQQSSTSTRKDNRQTRSRLPFRFNCDTFPDLPGREDENLLECQRWWICPRDQERCQSGQCLERSWFDDGEWDCPDASEEGDHLNRITDRTLREASVFDFTNRSFIVPSTCNESHPFLCLSSRAMHRGLSCFNRSQIGDGKIDCLGGHDERNTLNHCSQSSMVLGHHFLCASTNTCIPYYSHCLKIEDRCPNRSDDRLWCSGQRRLPDCPGRNDFVCWDGRCAKDGRCNRHADCSFNEDEEMCDFKSSFHGFMFPHRELKRFARADRSSILHFSPYPFDVNITEIDSHSSSTSPLWAPEISPSDSPSPYWCNRGVGILSTKNHSAIRCLCPPHYYGEKCEYHADRLSVVLRLDLSSSIDIDRNDPRILLQLLIIFLFDDEVLNIDRFHLHPSIELNSLLNNPKKKRTKLISHFVYPRSSAFLLHRRQRLFNRSSLLTRSPFSIRLELYQTRLNERATMLDLWKYPIDFAHLPVSRLARVLRSDRSSPRHANPCSAHPCPPNARCHPLANNRSEHICLCRENFTGKNCSQTDEECLQGYCTSSRALCQPNSRSSPFCLCPLNRYGKRCSIEYDACLSHPCLNNGSCFPDVRPDHVICLCRKEDFGSRCEMKRSSIHLSLSTDLPSRGIVLQIFQIDLSSIELILVQQQAFLTIPPRIEYYHSDQSLITGFVLAKLYSSDRASLADIHLVSVYEKIFSIDGRTKISSINRCEHRRTFSEQSSPIGHHHICISNRPRLCFRDDFYLCLCADNHTRVECFLLDDHLDRCELCRANGRCLQGDPDQSNDFVCLCPQCHSGRHCQFDTKSFSFTLDQLFSPDLYSHPRRTTTISLLIFFSLFTFVLALPNNLFSFVTLRRRSCLLYGVGHYLLWMSVINQLSLALLLARLLHLTLNSVNMFSPSSITNDIFCKSLNYLLSSSTRMVYWLTSLISIERLYTTLFLRGQWLRQPRIARRLIVCTFIAVFVSDLYELFFYKSFSIKIDEHRRGSICVLEISSQNRSLWMTFHLLFLILHSLLPFLINLFSTITICLIIVNKKINTSKETDQVSHSVWMRMRRRSRLVVDVLHDNREFVLGPAITLVPQLFSLPLFVSSFVFDCQNLENSWLRHFLVVSYWISFTPQWMSFFLYIVPSSLYSKEWRQTKPGRWMNTPSPWHAIASRRTASTAVSTARDLIQVKR